MPILNCSIHFVEKKADGSAAQLISADGSLELNQHSEDLLASFNQHYNSKPGKAMGCFSADSSLAARLSQLPDEFPGISQQLAQRWQQLVDEHELFQQTHLLVMHYRHSMSEFLVLAVLPQTSSLQINSALELEQVAHLDLEHMQLAARINLSEWQNQNGSQHYLSWFKPRGGKKLLEAFTSLIGCDEQDDAPAQTSNLLQAFSDYVEEQELPEDNVKEKANTLVKFANEHSKQGQPMALAELSEVLDEDNPQAFYNHIRNKDYGLSPFVPTDRRTLTQFQRFSGRAEGMSISFEAHLLGSRVEYDPERDTLIIRNPPTQLKDQLQRRQ